jgi:plasmid maintenance system antidote protein VapI
MMSNYPHSVIKRVYDADPGLLGVQLGRKCIALDIPVDDVAEFMHVSPVTVRSWFYGRAGVSAEHAQQISDILKKLS